MSVASSFAGDGDGSTLDSSRPGEHDGAMSSPDDRPGPGQSPSPNARAPQVPDPAPGPASTGGAEPDPEPFSIPVSCGNTEPSGDPGAGAGLDSGPPGEVAPSSSPGAPRETAPGSGAPGETAPSSSPGAPSPHPQQPRPPRSGAELAHLVLISILLC